MDSKQFVKLCRESGVIDARLSSTAADLAVIAKAQPLVGGWPTAGWIEPLVLLLGSPLQPIAARWSPQFARLAVSAMKNLPIT